MKKIIEKIQLENKAAVSRLFCEKHQSEYKYCILHYTINCGAVMKHPSNDILKCNEMEILLREEFPKEVFITSKNPLYREKVAV